MADPALRALHVLARSALCDAAGDAHATNSLLDKAEERAAEAPADPFVGLVKPVRRAPPEGQARSNSK